MVIITLTVLIVAILIYIKCYWQQTDTIVVNTTTYTISDEDRKRAYEQYLIDWKNLREKEKEENIDFILSETYFWKELKIELFLNEIECFENDICPYCKKELKKYKSNSFKCPNCKGKVYKKKTLNNNYGYFTEEIEKKREKELEEFKKRKKFTEIYRKLEQFELECVFGAYKNDNKLLLLNCLHQAKPYVKKENVSSFRMCRFYEAELQELLDYPTEALNIWLSVAYIDSWGFHSDISDFDEEDLERYNIKEWNKQSIAPYVIRKITKLHKTPQKLEGLYKSWVVNEVKRIINYDPPISDDEAWEILKEQLEKENV